MNTFGFPVQIENIDIDTEGKEEISGELGEANNYVVLEFDTDIEWENAQYYLGLKKVSTGEENPKIRRHGIGRVIKGNDILKKLQRLEKVEKES